MADDDETYRFGANYYRENHLEGTIVDQTTKNLSEDSFESSELEAAMIKRSEIAMRGRSDNQGGSTDSLRRSSIAGFPGLLTSQTDLNMYSRMNQQIMGMFIKRESEVGADSGLKSTSFTSLLPNERNASHSYLLDQSLQSNIVLRGKAKT